MFLDEIGELGLDEQAMILRAIEEKRFLPVDSDKETQSDFQLLVGTNKDLAHEVANGNFREDLLARLNLWTYHMPGLKDRREDIESNIEYELRKYSDENAQNAEEGGSPEIQDKMVAGVRSALSMHEQDRMVAGVRNHLSLIYNALDVTRHKKPMFHNGLEP